MVLDQKASKTKKKLSGEKICFEKLDIKNKFNYFPNEDKENPLSEDIFFYSEGNSMKKRHISKEEVEHLAWLARIELSEEEKDLFTKQINEILDYFKKIDTVDTKDVTPKYHVLDLVNVYREDKVLPSLPTKEVLKNAPKKEKKYG